MDKHLNPGLLTDLGQGRLSRQRSRRVVRHLLTDCAICCRAAAEVIPSYREAFARSWQEVEKREAELTVERELAPALLQELLSLPLERQAERVARDARFQTWSLCELLLDLLRDWGFQSPSRALELAQLGVDVAMRLNPTVYGESRVNDLAARAWVMLANAQRICASSQEADESFSRAEGLLKKGTGDPLEKAHLLLHKASLLGSRHRFGEAFRLLGRVTAIARRCEDPQLQGRVLIASASLLQRAAELECVTLGLIREVGTYLRENGAPAGLLRSRETR